MFTAIYVRKANKFYGAGVGRKPIKNENDLRECAAEGFKFLDIPVEKAYTASVKGIAQVMCLSIL